METFARELSLGIIRLEVFAWDLSLAKIVWDLWLEKSRLAPFARGLPLGSLRPIASARKLAHEASTRKLSFRIVRLEGLVRDR